MIMVMISTSKSHISLDRAIGLMTLRPTEPNEPEPVPAPTQVPAPPTPSAVPAPSLPPASVPSETAPQLSALPPSHSAAQSFLPPSQSSEPLAQSLSNATSPFTPQSTTLTSLSSAATAGIFQPHQPVSSTLQTSILPGASTQTSTPFSAFAPLGHQNASQTSTVQPLSHGLNSQYSQHGLPTHVDSPTLQTLPQSQHTSQNQPLSSYYRQQEYGFTPSNQSLLSQHTSQQQAGQQVQQEQGGYSGFSNLAQSFSQGQDFGGFNEQRV